MKKKKTILTIMMLFCILGLSVLYILPSINSFLENTKKSTIEAKSLNTEEVDSNTIVIDAGHGGYDSGSVSINDIYEKDITLTIALQVGDYLHNAGYNVVYTRSSDEVSWSDDNRDDLRTRVNIAQEANAAYFISIHTNASDAYNDGAYGFEAYLDYSNDTIETMATTILNNFDSLAYSQNRGLKSTEDYSLYVVNSNQVPALLLEIGFITDQDDVTYISSSQGQASIAKAIADGILSSI